MTKRELHAEGERRAEPVCERVYFDAVSILRQLTAPTDGAIEV
jgi:hypothetical protein